MKILLKPDLMETAILNCSGKTRAEKLSLFNYLYGIGGHFKQYWDVLIGYEGQWVEVDTTYLFTQSFNAILDTNGIFDIQQNIVADVDLSPEFNSIDEWIEAVQKRYDKDWPGTDVKHRMLFWYDRLKERYPLKGGNDVQI